MHVIKIDMVGPEALKRRIQCLENDVRPRVQHAILAIGIEYAFAGEGKFLPAMDDGLADQPFIRAKSIYRGRVKKGDTKIQRAIEQPYAVFLARRMAIGVAQIHASKPDRRNLKRADFSYRQGLH